MSTLLMPLHYIMYHLLGGFLRRESDLKLTMKPFSEEVDLNGDDLGLKSDELDLDSD